MAMAEIIRNPSHRHELELKKYLKPYTCDGCKEKGFGPRYRCEKCDFDLHEACTYRRIAPTSHEFFPGSRFFFLRTPPEPCHPECRIRCDACRNTIKGFVFHCEKDDLDLHPCCRNLSRTYQIEDVTFNLHKKAKGKCMWCDRKRLKDGGAHSGWSYVSECGKYHVHVACVTEMALEEWSKNESGGGRTRSSSSYLNSSGERSLTQRLNSNNAIQARGRGDGGIKNKFWRILKVIIKTIVSIVIGDPTMILASFFVDLLG